MCVGDSVHNHTHTHTHTQNTKIKIDERFVEVNGATVKQTLSLVLNFDTWRWEKKKKSKKQ